jgi:hypothetical protein
MSRFKALLVKTNKRKQSAGKKPISLKQTKLRIEMAIKKETPDVMVISSRLKPPVKSERKYKIK